MRISIDQQYSSQAGIAVPSLAATHALSVREGGRDLRPRERVASRILRAGGSKR